MSCGELEDIESPCAEEVKLKQWLVLTAVLLIPAAGVHAQRPEPIADGEVRAVYKANDKWMIEVHNSGPLEWTAWSIRFVAPTTSEKPMESSLTTDVYNVLAEGHPSKDNSPTIKAGEIRVLESPVSFGPGIEPQATLAAVVRVDGTAAGDERILADIFEGRRGAADAIAAALQEMGDLAASRNPHEVLRLLGAPGRSGASDRPQSAYAAKVVEERESIAHNARLALTAVQERGADASLVISALREILTNQLANARAHARRVRK
jgi:hypothetical protein